MTEVYQVAQKNGSWCALGSVKSQIGHAKSAAGIAGLIKAALALHHKVLPPTIKVEKPAPALEDGKTPFYVNTVKRPWLPAETHPRRAAVSSFGFGGSNFHCVLEEDVPRKPAIDWSGTTQILAFSADQLSELQAKVQTIDPQLSWPKLRSKAAQLRQQFEAKQTQRLVLVVEQEKTDLAKMLKNAQVMLDKNQGKTSWSTPDGIFYGKGAVPGKLGVIFPGQGSQYVGMLRDLSCQFPQFHEVLETANRVFQQGQNPSEIHRLSDLIYPHPTFTEEEHQKNVAVLQSTQIAQPAIGAVSLGLLKVLQYFGIQPEFVAGHSYGELVALCTADVLDAETFFAMSKLRGQLMGQKSGDKGSMLAVQGDLNFVKQIMAEDQIDLVIANRNSPQQTVLSGATSEVERAANVIKARGIRCKHLNVAAAFHSAFVADASGAFLEALKHAEIHAPTLPVYADSTTDLYPEDLDRIRELLAGQLANPVDFIGIIENMYASGVRTFFEVGPSSQMNGLIKAILEGKEVEILSVDTSGGKRSGETDLSRVLSQLAALGYSVKITAWDEHAPMLEEDAAAPKKRAMAVPISGANYFKPKPSKPPLTRQIVAMPDNGSGTQSPQTTFNKLSVGSPPAAASQIKTSGASGSQQQRHVQTKTISQAHQSFSPSPASASQATPQISPQQQAAAATPPAASSIATTASLDLSEALRMTQENLRTLQQFQQQSADLHRQFLEGQEATRQTFDRLFSQQQNLLFGTFLTQPAPQVASQAEAQTVPPSHQPVISASQTEQPSQPITSAAPPASQHHPATSEPALIAPMRISEPTMTTPASDTSQVENALLNVVSEKTGYPIDMLDLEMGLDADLGIDSIKRVEILSALQEQLPGIPEIRADQIGKLQTLRQIIELLGAGRPTPSAATAIPEPAATPSVDSGQVEKVLLDVVAEKTGYPQEMLDLDMGLDADLGIDSIKRVEILSALQRQLPGVPEISSDQLSQIQNLRQIVDFLSVSVVTPPRQRSAKTETVAPKTAGVDANQVKTVLLQVVSEKTGYPEEMLDLDMGLDADLGIDSIKRVEILSALQHQLPEAPEIGSDQIGEIQNLRQIVEFLTRASHISPEELDLQPHTQVEPATEITMSASEASASELERSVIVPVNLASPDTRKQITLESGSMIWITEDGTELSAKLASMLQQQGFQTQCLALSQIAETIVPRSLRGLILLAPASETLSPSFVNQAFLALQHAGTVLRQQPSVFMTVSRLDGKFGFGSLNPTVNPISGGLAGLAKTVGREWPQVQSKALDLSPEIEGIEAIADVIANELLRIGPVEVGVTTQGRFALQLEPQPLVPDDMTGRLSHKDVIIVSGGARGVTAACALAIAQTWQPTMILLGRSPAPAPEPSWLAGLADEADIKQGIIRQADRKLGPKEVGQSYQQIAANREILHTLASIEATGAKAIYRSVDVRDARAVQAVLNEIQEQYGAITGLVHGAGVLADKKIEDKTADQFDRVYGTKVEGALNLLAGLQSNPLKILVFFSSTTARLGRVGQVDYAAANEVLNKIAQQQARLRPDCRVVAVNWGPWAGGMVTPALERIFASEGIGLIPLQAGAQYLVQELSLTPASAPIEIVILKGQAGKADMTPLKSASTTQIPQAPSSTEAAMYVAFERTLTIVEYPFLASHVINGRAVLPMAMSIEWMAHAALHNHPGLLLQGFNDLRMLKGIALQRKESYAIRVLVGEAAKRDGVLLVPVEMRGVTSAGQDVLHVRAEFLLSAKLQRGQRIIKGLATEGYPHQNGDVYRQYLFHGPDFHGIEQVEGYAANGIVARVKAAPHPSSWIKQPLRKYWLTDPLMIDSGFQLLILWSFAQYQAGSLPAYIGQYRQFVSKFSPEGGRIVAKVTKSEQHRACATIEFLDPRGNLLARMEEYECTIDSSLNQTFRKNVLAD